MGGSNRVINLALVVLVDGEAGEAVGLDAVGGGGARALAAEDVAGHVSDREGGGADEEEEEEGNAHALSRGVLCGF